MFCKLALIMRQVGALLQAIVTMELSKPILRRMLARSHRSKLDPTSGLCASNFGGSFREKLSHQEGLGGRTWSMGLTGPPLGASFNAKRTLGPSKFSTPVAKCRLEKGERHMRRGAVVVGLTGGAH